MHALLARITAAVVMTAFVRPATSCTGFHVFQDGLAIAGNNADFWNPDTRVWFVPAEGGRHGRIYFGFANLSPSAALVESSRSRQANASRGRTSVPRFASGSMSMRST